MGQCNGGTLPKTEVSGFCHPRFAEVDKIFRQQVESGMEPGGAFTVYHQGELVVDLRGGWADREAGRQWSQDTLTMVFSISKSVAAIVAAKMVDRGWLDYEKPVSHYWPEFQKHNITVAMLLSHQAGLVWLDTPVSLQDLVHHREDVERKLATQQPSPDVPFGYHALTYGLFVDTLLQKAHPEKKNISEIFEEEIGKPFGVEFYYGVPKSEQGRVAKMVEWGSFGAVLRILMDPLQRPMMLSTARNPLFQRALQAFGKDTFTVSTFNDPEVQAVPLSSFLGISSAASLARLYGIIANDGSIQGKQLLSPDVLQQLVSPVVEAEDKILGFRLKRSPGLFVDVKTKNTVGHGGFGGQLAYADLDNKLGVAYVTNYLGNYPITDLRCAKLEDALYRALKTNAET